MSRAGLSGLPLSSHGRQSICIAPLHRHCRQSGCYQVSLTSQLCDSHPAQLAGTQIKIKCAKSSCSSSRSCYSDGAHQRLPHRPEEDDGEVILQECKGERPDEIEEQLGPQDDLPAAKLFAPDMWLNHCNEHHGENSGENT
jgi:hypothetical protein